MTIPRPASQFLPETQDAESVIFPRTLSLAPDNLKPAKGEADGGARTYTPEGYKFNVTKIVAARVKVSSKRGREIGNERRRKREKAVGIPWTAVPQSGRREWGKHTGE